jgi:hypothetical protein
MAERKHVLYRKSNNFTPASVIDGQRTISKEVREEGREKREEGRGKREEGRGKREEGRGKREEGRGKREEVRGKREFSNKNSEKIPKVCNLELFSNTNCNSLSPKISESEITKFSKGTCVTMLKISLWISRGIVPRSISKRSSEIASAGD